MKNTFRLIPAVLAAIAVLAGCVQEITSPSFEKDKVNPAAEGSRVIAVSFSQQTKTYLDKDGLQPKFEDGKDTVLISNTNALDTCVVSVKDNKATISTNLTGPLTAVYPYKAAKMSEGNENEIDTVLVSTVQSGKFADANICMAKMTSENDESLSFENKTAVFCIYPPTGKDAQHVEVSAEGFVIANNIPTESAITDSSTIHVNTTTADSVYVSILVPEGLTVGSLSFSDGTNVKTIKDERASTAIVAGTLYTVTKDDWKSTEADIPDGALKGVFTVGAGPDGKAGTADDIKVYFSQGNLRYVVGTDDWGFYEHQYDFCNATTFEGHHSDTISLFTWGYSESTSLLPAGNTYVTAHTTTEDKQLVYNTDSGDDWGVAYCNSNNIAVGTWRTLSTAEWQYLFNTRAFNNGTNTGEGYSYQRAKINSDATGVYGMILYPDNYTGTPKASYTSDEWVSLENEGCVFLPGAGDRDGSNVYGVGGGGVYWSSAAYGGLRAYSVDFFSINVIPDNTDTRDFGFSVRLVTDVSAAPTPTEPTSEYVEIAADYDNNPNTANTTLKWYRQNLAITDSGNKFWKGGNDSAVKIPGTDDDVIVGDYFQWGTYKGYCGDATAADKGLLIYESFTNKYCVNGGSEDKFEFKTTEAGIAYQFSTSWSEDSTSAGISPYFDGSKGEYGEYTKYTGTDDAILDSSDDVANIILGDNWRMPTKAEFQAMKDVTYWAWDSDDMGYYVYAPASGDEGGLNGKQSDGETSVSGTYTKSDALLFFPAAGSGYGTDLNVGDFGYYWSGSLGSSYTDYAYGLYFYSVDVNPQGYYDRYSGLSVRPVSE